VKVSLFLT